jgi:predicted ATP-dependent endonuclease of OLD family
METVLVSMSQDIQQYFMTNIKFISFQVKRFRSLMDVTLDISQDTPTIICGENNIGKTNFLRALNLYFNHLSDVVFIPKEDLPYHIVNGSGGGGTKTELTGNFEKDNTKLSVKVLFFKNGEIQYKIDNKNCNVDSVSDLLKNFRFIFIESHNVNLPNLIATILEKDGLLSLDTKRTKQSAPLKKLEEFIELSQKAISDIEREINTCFESLTDFDGILKGKQVKIYFAEFEKLRDVVKTMTEITLFDSNTLSVSSKGSGAQRALFLALMQYISNNSKQNVIWGVDEPEAFLQPKLQKKVASVFSEITQKESQQIVLTTHSQHFIDLRELTHTHLFQGKEEPKTYTRQPGKKFMEMNTIPILKVSPSEKASLIKDHLGIDSNDGWKLMPLNIIVEGEEDKIYLEALFKLSDFHSPNIVWAGGASKIGGYLQFYNNMANDLNYKPKIICLFDNDKEGNEQSHKVKSKSIPKLESKVLFLPRYDGETTDMKNRHKDEWEIEDFMPPELIIKAINSILKKHSYKSIRKPQIDNRGKIANIGKGILKYSEECSAANNPGKQSFSIDAESRKRQICQKVCQLLESEKWDLDV